MTVFLNDDGGLTVSRGTGVSLRFLSILDGTEKEITSYTDSASSSDRSLLWDNGYESQGMGDVMVIEGPVEEAADYKIVIWFSNFSSGSRPGYLGTLKAHYTHSGGSEQTITHPNGTVFFKPWSWYYSGTTLGDPDYAGNEDDGTGAFTDYGPWKVESPVFTVTDINENIAVRLEPIAAGFFVAALQVLKQ